MDSSNQLLNTLGDTAKKATQNTVRAAGEEIKKAGDSTANQISPTPLTEEQIKATRSEVEGIYGGKEAVMDPTTYTKKAADDKKQTLGLIDQILGQLLGPNSKMKDNRKEHVATEHKKQAEELGQTQETSEKQEEMQKKKQEEAEEKQKKEEKKIKLEQQIAAPDGKHTGLSFKRKGNAPRMLRPPTAETRGGKGNRE